MRVHVAFTPAQAASASTAIVIDVLRATSTIAQALDSGYRQVLCCPEVEQATTVRAEVGSGVLAGERGCVRIPGFDLGNSPREFLEPIGDTIILTTTNGTRALAVAASLCDEVVAGCLLNLDAVVEAVTAEGRDVLVLCAGVQGELAMDDAYCAGRLVELLAGDPTDAANAALRIARSFPGAYEGLAASQSARNLLDAGLEEDIAWCARESVLRVVPRVSGAVGASVRLELRSASTDVAPDDGWLKAR